MANPRKFSEKIALHNQKQAEETAAFEKIMKEVMDATVPKPEPPQQTTKQNNLLSINLQSSFRGGSLPNVNQMILHGDKSPTSRMGQMLHQQGISPRSSRNSIGPLRVSKTRATDHAPYASPPNLSNLHSMSSHSGNLGSAGFVYGTNNYLSPPMENAAWRRANSDSALNSHSLMIPSVVPDSSEESSNNSNDPRDNYVLSVGKTHDSPNQIPNTVGDGPNLLEIPTHVSTGSLPDLTNFQFAPPLQQPVDMEEQLPNHSPYSTSPLSVTYSPTSMSPHPPQPQQQQSPSQPQRQSQQQGHMTQSQLSQQQQSMMDNPLQVNVNTSFQNYSSNENMLTAYRCPPRPSPQNSPLSFRSPSPLDGHLSAPPSPTAQPTQNSPENYFVSQQQLQQHFEQISMMETTPNRNGHGWQGGGMASSAQYNFYNQAQQIQTGATAGVTAQHSPQHPQPQTPQTPSSIPDIIFTEFLGADFSEVHSSEPTNLEEFLASDAAAQALREGLGPIDLDGLQMLAHPDLVPLDPQAEDTFRLDRL